MQYVNRFKITLTRNEINYYSYCRFIHVVENGKYLWRKRNEKIDRDTIVAEMQRLNKAIMSDVTLSIELASDMACKLNVSGLYQWYFSVELMKNIQYIGSREDLANADIFSFVDEQGNIIEMDWTDWMLLLDGKFYIHKLVAFKDEMNFEWKAKEIKRLGELLIQNNIHEFLNINPELAIAFTNEIFAESKLAVCGNVETENSKKILKLKPTYGNFEIDFKLVLSFTSKFLSIEIQTSQATKLIANYRLGNQ